MKTTKAIIFPALLALSLFGATHVYAGSVEDPNPAVDPMTPHDPDPNMPPDTDPNMPPDGGEHVDKGGNPPTPPGPTPQPPKTDGDGGGTHGKRVFLCVVGNQQYYVRYAAECRGPRVVYQQPRVIYAQPKKRVRTVRYAAPCNCAAPRVTYGNGGGDIVIGGGYASSGTRFIGSPAAVAQARKRANRQLQYGGGYAYGGGYSDGGGYYEQAPVVRRKAKRVRVQAYNPYPVYDPGVVIHYGPVIMKDGAY